MSLRKDSIKGVIWSFTENVGLRVVSVSVFFLLAILLDPEAFGLIALANAFVTFGNRFVEQGLVTAIVQKEDLENAHINSAFWGNLAIGSLFTLLTLFLAPYLASLFGEIALTNVLRWFSLIFLINAFGKVQEALLLKHLKFKSLAKRRIIAVISGGIVGIGMALMGFGVYSMVGQVLVFQAVQAIILWRESSWRPGFYFSIQHYLALFSFGVKMMLNNLVIYLYQYSADLLIGYFLGTVALGYYSIAYKVYTTLVDLMTNTVTKVTLPLFSKLQSQIEPLKNTLLKISQYACYASFPVFTGVIVLAPTLIPIFFGEKWVPSIPSMQLLAGAGMISTIYAILDSAVIAKGRALVSLKVHSINAVGNLVFFLLFVEYGIEAIAATFVVRATLLLPVLFYFAQPFLFFSPKEYFLSLGKPFVATFSSVAILGLIYLLLSPYPLLFWIVGGAAATGIYLYLIRVMSPEIFPYLLSFLQPKTMKSLK